jgi:hypothetical protein
MMCNAWRPPTHLQLNDGTNRFFEKAIFLLSSVSSFGTKRTSPSREQMSAFEGKAEITQAQADVC